ncbi:MAG: FHA domain-containing protein [Planctomycetes bacterium]|nr:FHA domain-containing protein [Planctomycetota bacterium]
MAKYVLQIVEGPHAGTKQELRSDVTIGRRTGCELVLDQDEKLSGRHCQIVLEGDGVLLRDLDSTNGTRVDGKRIQELPIAHGDRFQIGLTVVQLVDLDQGDVSLESSQSIGIDAEVLARTGKRSPVALLVLLALLLGGGAAYWFFLRDTEQRGTKAERKVVAIPGNLLPQALAQLEGGDEEWLPGPVGDGFVRGAPAKSGKSALVADLAPATDDAAGRLFAVAMQPKPTDVARKVAVRAQAAVRTDGRARVGLRLVFFDKAQVPVRGVGEGGEEDGEPVGETRGANARFTREPLFVFGSPLSAIEPGSWTTLETVCKVPAGCAEVGIAIVAALADGSSEEAQVAVDEIALLDADAEAAGVASEFAGTTVFSIPESAGLRVRVGASVLLSGTSALPGRDGSPSDSALTGLAEALPLPCCDVFETQSLVVENGLAKLQTNGQGRLVLMVPRDVAASYRVRSGEGAGVFVQDSGPAQFENATALLWGVGQQTLMFETETPSKLVVRVDGDFARFVFDTTKSASLRLDFQEQRLEALRLMRTADAARSEGRIADALRVYRQILQEKPYDVQAVRDARTHRATLLTEAQNDLVALERDFDEARAFQYDGLFVRLLERADALDARQDELKDSIAAFRKKVESRLDAVRTERGRRRAEALGSLAAGLASAGQDRLARVVREFVSTRLPAAAATDGADNGDSNGGRD